eukprot:377883-Amphidinium_carterae.1
MAAEYVLCQCQGGESWLWWLSKQQNSCWSFCLGCVQSTKILTAWVKFLVVTTMWCSSIPEGLAGKVSKDLTSINCGQHEDGVCCARRSCDREAGPSLALHSAKLCCLFLTDFPVSWTTLNFAGVCTTGFAAYAALHTKVARVAAKDGFCRHLPPR